MWGVAGYQLKKVQMATRVLPSSLLVDVSPLHEIYKYARTSSWDALGIQQELDRVIACRLFMYKEINSVLYYNISL